LKSRNNKGQITERISLEQYIREIQEAILQVENGAFYTQEEMEKIL